MAALAVHGEHRSGGLEELGRGPGRWATADGFINFDSVQSFSAKGLLQFKVELDFFPDDVGRRRGRRPLEVHEGPRGFSVISVLVRVLCERWLLQLLLYPLLTCLYLYVFMYVFLI
ncbi:unnamed protein product [Urochloa humidicola]